MSSQQTSTGAHEAYTKYDESLGRRNSSRLPDTRQGSQRTRSNRPHSMHERANSLRNTQTGECAFEDCFLLRQKLCGSDPSTL